MYVHYSIFSRVLILKIILHEQAFSYYADVRTHETKNFLRKSKISANFANFPKFSRYIL